MGRDKLGKTPAIRFMEEKQMTFRLHSYHYVEKGGTDCASRALQVDEHAIIKTLVFEDDKQNPFIVLMHGDMQVSKKSLARQLEVAKVKPCDPREANRHTGYVVGGISPFGIRKRLPVYFESSILTLPQIYLNAGRRGLLVEISPQVIIESLSAKAVSVAT